VEANVRGSRDPDLKLEVGPFPTRPFLTRTFSNSEEVEPAFGGSTGPRQVPSYWCVEISSLSEKAGGKRAHDKEDAHSNEGRAALVRAQVAFARVATGLAWTGLEVLAEGASAAGAVAIGAFAIRSL
jgi:hypothetical protein